MARKPKIYQKLARRRGGIGTYFSLWLGPDHVLQVEANMITERYQRVFFNDVQGFFVRPSRVARWVTVTSLVLVALFTGAAVLWSDAAQVFVTLASLAGVVLLYGLFGARNCHFHVVTAVQRMEWTNVARYRQARKLRARLEPLIQDAQRGVTAPAAPTAPDVFAAS